MPEVSKENMDGESHTEVDEKKVPWWTSCRFCLAIIGFFGFVHNYAQRVGMSVAIVCMVNQTAVKQLEDFNATATGTVYTNGHTNGHGNISDIIMDPVSEKEVMDGPFVWSKDIQGHILGSFFYGYLVSQIPAGMLAERYGGKWVFFGFSALSTLMTLLTPVAAQMHWIMLIVVRVIAGIGSGAVYPAMHAMWSRWAPPTERSKLTNITYAGSWMGCVIGLPLSGVLCRMGFAGGWGSIFYVIGLSSSAWLVLWAFLVSDTPSTHRRISAVERDYINYSLKGQISNDSKRKERVPWIAIFTSPPVYAVLIAAITCDWGLYTFLTNIPTYLNEVLKFDIQSNGLYSALPFLSLWAIMNIAPVIADRLITSKVLSILNTRKVMQTVGSFGAGGFLIGLAFMDENTSGLAMALLTAGVAISGTVYCGYMVNLMDFAPKYAGTLMGVANGLASCTGFLAPFSVAKLTPNGTSGEWQRVFFLASALYFFGALFFIVFGRGEVQSWARDSESDIYMDDVAVEVEMQPLSEEEKKQAEAEDRPTPAPRKALIAEA